VKKINKESILLFLLEEISLILIFLFLGIFAYLKPRGILNLHTLVFTLYSAIPIGFLVLAESIALFSGNFDLSVGQIAGLSALTAGNFLVILPGFPPVFSIILPVIIGMLAGSLNGLLVGRLKLNPFIATLGTYMFFKGLKLIIRKSSIWSTDLPKFYLSIGKDILTTVLVFFILLVVLWFFFKYTKLGISIYAVGGNAQSSYMLGIGIANLYFVTYIIDGAMCGLAGLFYTGYDQGVPINIAEGTMMIAFAGAIIGGVSLRGGRGSVINAFWGILLLGVIETGLAMFAVSSEVRMASYGILVITAVIIAGFKDSLREKVLKPKS